MEKKNIVTSILLIALIISGIGNIVLIFDILLPPLEESPDFIIGTTSGPATLELVDSWDSSSNLILEQVVETLFSYDLTDLDLPRINKLAHSYWWENHTTLHIQLRKGIIFHDRTPFNAAAAKWNLDRLQFLTNSTGTNYGKVAHTQSLWRFPDGKTPIMNIITAVGDYNITITLNDPYGPFLNTLAYINAGMISPTAHAADETSFIDLTSGDVVGTGPFKYGYFTPNEGVYLSRWEGYWRNLANFRKIKFTIIPDWSERNYAMLDKSIDLLIGIDPSFIPSFENDSSITVRRFTDDTGIPGLACHYFQFNYDQINKTWRKAMSFAINYTYIINEMTSGSVVRAKSLISPAFGASFNASLEAVDINITKAREVVVSMGFGDMGWSDAQWQTIADYSPFLTVRFHYQTGHTFKEDLFVALNDWMSLLGINVRIPSWEPPFFDPEYCDFFWTGWAPDYLDPYKMFDPLFNPLSDDYRLYKINDTWLNDRMTSALQTLDDKARNEIYKTIQWYLTERLYPQAFGYHPKIYFVHSADIYDVPYNAMNRFEAYGIRRA